MVSLARTGERLSGNCSPQRVHKKAFLALQGFSGATASAFLAVAPDVVLDLLSTKNASAASAAISLANHPICQAAAFELRRLPDRLRTEGLGGAKALTCGSGSWTSWLRPAAMEGEPVGL